MRVAAEVNPGDSHAAHGAAEGSLHLHEGEQGPLPVPTGSDPAGSDSTPCDRLSWRGFQGTGHAGDSNESSRGGYAPHASYGRSIPGPTDHIRGFEVTSGLSEPRPDRPVTTSGTGSRTTDPVQATGSQVRLHPRYDYEYEPPWVRTRSGGAVPTHPTLNRRTSGSIPGPLPVQLPVGRQTFPVGLGGTTTPRGDRPKLHMSGITLGIVGTPPWGGGGGALQAPALTS